MKKILSVLLGIFAIANISHALTFIPQQGGTGTSTAPIFGQLLVGNSQGTYTLTATSSLGISSGAGLQGGTAGMLSAWTSSSALTATSAPTGAFFIATSTIASRFPYASSTSLSADCFWLNGTGCLTSGGGSSFGQAFEIDSSNYLSATTTNSFGINANSQGTTYGYGIGGILLIYSSSTNANLVFGVGAGGQGATTSPATTNVTAFGFNALQSNTTGSGLVAIGSGALSSNISGLNSVAIGYGALQKNTTLSSNVAIGQQAMNNKIIAADSVAIGRNALQNGSGANGTQNVAIGSTAGAGSTGNNNTYIGTFTGGTTTPLTGSNNILLGFDITTTANNSNILDIGNIIYGTSINGEGTNLSTGLIGIATSSPWGLLSVNPNLLGANVPAFVIGSSTATNFIVDNAGNVGIGTTTPGSIFSINGVANFRSATSSFYGNGLDLLGGCFSIRGICVGGGGGGSGTVSASTLQGQFPFYNSVGTTLTATSSLFISQKGLIGIGTSTPNWNLQVAGTRPFFTLSDMNAGTNQKHWFFSSQGGNLYVGTTTDSFATTTGYQFLTMTTQSLQGTNFGRLGIGTTSPYAQLSIHDTNATTSLAKVTLFAIGSTTSTGLFKTVFEVTSTGSTTAAGRISDGSGIVNPSGMVAFFDLATCPSGWTASTTLQGRYLVGVPSGGTLGANVGTALTNKENRATGSHTHSYFDAGIAGAALIPNGAGTLGQPAETAVPTGASNQVAGTNAPYAQLLVCRKD